MPRGETELELESTEQAEGTQPGLTCGGIATTTEHAWPAAVVERRVEYDLDPSFSRSVRHKTSFDLEHGAVNPARRNHLAPGGGTGPDCTAEQDSLFRIIVGT